MKAKRQKAEIATCLFLPPFLSHFSFVAVHLQREGKRFHVFGGRSPHTFFVKRDWSMFFS